jgi:uncharacterized protein (TIGR03437 family)
MRHRICLLWFCLAGAALHAQPVISSVVNAFSFQPPLSPGGYAAIFGTNLGSDANPHVTVGGKAAYILSATNNQFNIQIPVDAPAGSTNITISTNGGTSPAFFVTLAQYAPALLTIGGNGTGHAVEANFAPTFTNPTKAGDAITLAATGLGATNPSVPTGFTTPAAQIPTVATVTATIGGKAAPVVYAGLAPGYVGAYQINLTVPAGLSTGDQAVTINIGNVSSQANVTVPVVGTTTITQVGDPFKLGSKLAPGGQAAIIGTSLGDSGSVVKIGGKTAPVLSASGGTRLDVQIPVEQARPRSP